MEYETLKTLIEMALLHLRVHLCVKARGAELGAHTERARDLANQRCVDIGCSVLPEKLR